MLQAPDTLGCYPFADDDPFIFEYCPEIYFAGNQDAFGDRVWKSKISASSLFILFYFVYDHKFIFWSDHKIMLI